MEPETSIPQVEVESKFECVTKVTPLSKYLVMFLFIMMPFIGGWIGYEYAPEKVIEVEKVVKVNLSDSNKQNESVTEEIEVANRDGEPSDKLRVVSIKESKDEDLTLTCNHSRLNDLSVYSYSDWPVYTATDFGISFSYPPDHKPNFEDRFTDESGYEHLQVGYNPNIDPTISGVPATEFYWSIDGAWQVEIYRGLNNDSRINPDYCSEYFVCLMEEVDYSQGLRTYVSTFMDFGMADDLYLREYEIHQHESYNDNRVIRISSPAAASLEGPACLAVLSVTNLDRIGHSVRLDK